MAAWSPLEAAEYAAAKERGMVKLLITERIAERRVPLAPHHHCAPGKAQKAEAGHTKPSVSQRRRD